MLHFDNKTKINLVCGFTDMRKGVHGLSLYIGDFLDSSPLCSNAYIFRGKSSDKIKILFWDGQGYCLYYKLLPSGKYTWPSLHSQDTSEGCTSSDNNCKDLVSITSAQFSMLLEGIDWRAPKWSDPPVNVG